MATELAISGFSAQGAHPLEAVVAERKADPAAGLLTFTSGAPSTESVPAVNLVTESAISGSSAQGAHPLEAVMAERKADPAAGLLTFFSGAPSASPSAESVLMGGGKSSTTPSSKTSKKKAEAKQANLNAKMSGDPDKAKFIAPPANAPTAKCSTKTSAAKKKALKEARAKAKAVVFQHHLLTHLPQRCQQLKRCR